MRLTTIVLDLDDTLYLERDYVRSGIAAVGAWFHTCHGIEGFAKEAQRRWDEGRRTKLFDATLMDLGAAPDPALIDAAVLTYRAHLPQIALAPDAAAFLAAPRRHRLALITDGPPLAQLNKITALGLDRLGIDPLIRTGVWGDQYCKPHERAFRMVETRHGASGDRIVYVADNPAKDFLTPRALGWRTVQIDRPGAVHPRAPASAGHAANCVITSFDELEHALAAVRA